jgi:hypothetical protein
VELKQVLTLVLAQLHGASTSTSSEAHSNCITISSPPSSTSVKSSHRQVPKFSLSQNFKLRNSSTLPHVLLCTASKIIQYTNCERLSYCNSLGIKTETLADKEYINPLKNQNSPSVIIQIQSPGASAPSPRTTKHSTRATPSSR